LAISSAVWIQYTNVTDGQTDGHRATAKTALASRGKKNDNIHKLKWKSFKCILVTVMTSDDCAAKFYILNFKVTDPQTEVPDPKTEAPDLGSGGMGSG